MRGVDLTPKLALIARERTGKEVDVANALDWLEKQEDGSYLGRGYRQIFGFLDYKNVEPVCLVYDSKGIFQEFRK